MLDPASGRMQPVGVLDVDGTGSFAVDGLDLAAYPQVDVSDEPDDGDPRHSAVSVLRGPLTG